MSPNLCGTREKLTRYQPQEVPRMSDDRTRNDPRGSGTFSPPGERPTHGALPPLEPQQISEVSHDVLEDL